MNFIYPQFLWALLAIAIPIIIHLFNFRKFKKVYFSDVSLLKQVELETSKKSNITHLLILLARILAIAALVFAFAQPYFNNEENGNRIGEKIVSVYLDNSLSMNNKWNEFTVLDYAKKQAMQVANSFEQNDKFLLITNDFKPIHQRFLTKDEFVNEIDEIGISSVSRKMSAVEQKQIDFLNKEASQNKWAFYISDFQKSTSDITELKLDSTVSVTVLPVSGSYAGNVWIDSVWFESPVRMVNKKEKLHARIVNSTPDDIQIKLELSLNGKVKGLLNEDVMGNSESEISLDYLVHESGEIAGVLSLSEYPEPNAIFDDSYYFSYLLKPESKVLVINQSSEFLDGKQGNVNQLFFKDEFFKVENALVSSLDYGEFDKSDLIIINEVNSFSSGFITQILGYVNSGGTLFIIPSAKADLETTNELLIATMGGRILSKDTANTKVSWLDFENSFFKDVFQKVPKNMNLPSVGNQYKFDFSSRSGTNSLAKTQNGNSFLAMNQSKKGKVFTTSVSFSPDFSNFASHSLFVTTLLRVAESSGVSQQSAVFTNTNSVRVKNETILADDLRILNESGSIDFIPETEISGSELELFFGQNIKESGSYKLMSDKSIAYSFGVNYHRDESQFEFYSPEDLSSQLTRNWVSVASLSENQLSNNSTDFLSSKDKLWKILLLLALLFFAIEIALIKFLN